MRPGSFRRDILRFAAVLRHVSRDSWYDRRSAAGVGLAQGAYVLLVAMMARVDLAAGSSLAVREVAAALPAGGSVSVLRSPFSARQVLSDPYLGASVASVLEGEGPLPLLDHYREFGSEDVAVFDDRLSWWSLGYLPFLEDGVRLRLAHRESRVLASSDAR